jgi:hypothetical protein
MIVRIILYLLNIEYDVHLINRNVEIETKERELDECLPHLILTTFKD